MRAPKSTHHRALLDERRVEKIVRDQETLVMIRQRFAMIRVQNVSARASCSPWPRERAIKKTASTIARTLNPWRRLIPTNFLPKRDSFVFLGRPSHDVLLGRHGFKDNGTRRVNDKFEKDNVNR